MTYKPVLGILLGDATGVGPEIVAKLAVADFFAQYCRPVIIGDVRVLERGLKIINGQTRYYVIKDVSEADWSKGLPVLDQHNQNPEQIPIGKICASCGAASLAMLKTAVELYQAGKIEGFCFVPFNKAAMLESGCQFESEHYYMAHLFHNEEPFGEINVVGDVWACRTTSHIPICEVSQSLSVDRILRAIRLANSSLRQTGIKEPRIGVAALNPHCGEGGRCGTEEIKIISPAIAKAQEMGIKAEGPFPSDILFIKAFKGQFDGVVTMYHDQGQIALKLKGFDEGITIAGGQPAPIATCAHGTAYDIAGKGIVRTRAFENAVKMVSKMAAHLATVKATAGK